MRNMEMDYRLLIGDEDEDEDDDEDGCLGHGYYDDRND